MLINKYKPNDIDSIIGNKQVIMTLCKWLKSWDKSNKKNNCALLSGPCGIGKSLTIDLLIKKYNLNPIYLDTNERRDKEYITNHIIPIIKNEHSLFGKQNILVINDIDYADDNGFIASVSECMKNSQIPIVATCNNRYNQTIKPLLIYFSDFKFYKPFQNDILKFLVHIVKSEKKNISESNLKNIIEESGYDIRNCLNNLQIYRNKYIGIKDKIQTNIFDVTKLLLSQSIVFKDKYDLFWFEPDIIPLMIHENYINNNIKMKNEYESLKNISKACDYLCDSNIISNQINAVNWELSPYIACSVIGITENCVSKTQIKFTNYLSKISTINKHKKMKSNSNLNIDEIRFCSINFNNYSLKILESQIKMETNDRNTKKKEVKPKTIKKIKTEIKTKQETKLKKKKLLIIEEDDNK